MDKSTIDPDSTWMQQALQLAELGQGCVEPNPMVGCVLVRDGHLISQGYHERFGGPHAECVAVSAAIRSGLKDRLPGSTAYVTLEPCCHHGKTPPCTNLLIENGIRRVVIAAKDPFLAVAGKGIEQLQAAGIQVEVGIHTTAAQELNAPYLKRVLSGRPWVIGKWAMSLDGKIATRTGNSQWISGQTSREMVHQLRSRVDAVMVGRSTAVADDPLLTARLPEGQKPLRTALRVVIDSKLSTSATSQLVATSYQFPTLIWAGPQVEKSRAEIFRSQGCRVEICDEIDEQVRLDRLLTFLASEYSATNLLVEGGQKLLGSLLDLQQIDECHAFIAPKIIGGQSAISPIGGMGVPSVSQGPRCYAVERRNLGEDVYFTCRLDWGPQPIGNG